MASSGRKKAVFACLGLNVAMYTLSKGVFPPVFPIEVRIIHPSHARGAGGIAVGLVFSFAAFAQFLFAPFVGREIPRLGAKHMNVLGYFLVGGSLALFSFVSEIHEWSDFLGICYALRISEGFGRAMIQVSSFALLFGTFPEKVASATGILEIFISLGYVIGPIVGGVLFQFGGFRTPFLFSAGLLFLASVMGQLVLPKPAMETQSKLLGDDTFPVRAILCVPESVLMLCASFFSSMVPGFFDPALGPLLHEKFELSRSSVGAVYPLCQFFFMLFSPVVGYFADSKRARTFLIPFGCFMSAVGFALMGADVAFGMKQLLGVLVAGYAVVGIGATFIGTPLAADLLDTMRSRGHADTAGLHGAIGGNLGAAHSLGLTVGPIIGGAVSGSFKFGDGAVLFAFIFVLLGAVLVLHTAFCWWRARCRGRQPSLPPDDKIPLASFAANTSD